MNVCQITENIYLKQNNEAKNPKYNLHSRPFHKFKLKLKFASAVITQILVEAKNNEY